MTHSVFSFRFRPTVVAMAVCAVCVTAQAQSDPEQAKLVEATVSVGLGLVDGSSFDRALFGQYNGLHSDRNLVGMLGIDYSLRNPATSTWVDFQGDNLLGDSRELHLVWKRPGEWKFTADYGELTRSDPNTVNTGLLGAGTTTPQVVLVPVGAGSDFELKTKRTGLGIGFAKQINPAWQFEIDLKSENKKGSRLFGVGMNCPSPIDLSCGSTTGINTGWALLMLPEPIDSNHSQVEARVSYGKEKLRLSLGYYGSFYRNSNTSLTPGVPPSLNNPLGGPLPLSVGLGGLLSQPLALSPDNQAHQIDLTGSYDFSRTTHGTFKLAYASATQDDDFAVPGGPPGVGNLAGKVTTTMAKIGITSRPIPKLSLIADLRYEDKDDQTPIRCYNPLGSVPPCVITDPNGFTNRNLPQIKTQGKMQASWQFSSDYRGTLGADYEAIDRGVFTASSAVSGISALRQKTQETGLRAELRRRMSENFSGAITLSSSQRDGSNWLRDNSGRGVTEVTDPTTGFLPSAIFMPSLADRQRDKVKFFADWQPSEKLTLQFSAEESKDKFSTPSSYGLHDSRTNQFGVDWTYAQSFAWNFNGYVSQGIQTFNQSRYQGYVMAFENTNLSAGVGFTGKVSGQLQVGGMVTYSDDKSVYAQSLDANAGTFNSAALAAAGGLPDVSYRQTALKLFGQYALDKRSAIRVDLVHQRTDTNDWAWAYNGVPFTYSDGTTVTQKQSQSVGFIGVTYIYQLP